ncbi:MAG: hypothetical protein J5880_00995, partial [Bacilli bacterium]|nr:hypothetical protein [Bacilli bacterium]
IGYGIASKTIEDFTLIAIAVRGGNYDGEWASNFTIGGEGNSQGFDEASDKVVAGFERYCNLFSIQGHIKIWISGYSRAAITSNMTAGKLLNRMVNNSYSNDAYHYSVDDVYAYCFEPPMGVNTSLKDARSELYKGIHNFLNYNDLVPLVAPYEWGFVRYGTDHYYPDRLNDIYFEESEREKIISLYHFTYGAQNFHDYTVDQWKFFDVGEFKTNKYDLPCQSIHPSQGRFVRSLIHEIALTGFGSREVYHKNLQDGVRQLFATAYGLNPDIEKISGSSMVEIIFEYDFIKSLFLELENCQSDQFALDMEMLFLQIFGAKDENFKAVKKLYNENFDFFYLLPQSFQRRKDILAQFLYRDNLMNIAVGHMPEISYSFLSACDSRFLGEKACKFNDGSYQILHVENPNAFTLYEKNLEKDIFIYKDGVMSSEYISAEQYGDGDIDIYLPKNGKYEYVGECETVSLSYADPLEGEFLVEDAMPLRGEF